MTRITNLTTEFDDHKNHIERMRQLILSNKASLFRVSDSESYSRVIDVIMQTCVLPRVLMSPTDATFCSRFFFYLHDIDTPGFSTLSFIDKAVKTVTPLLFCSTEYEARFIGFLFYDMFMKLNAWGASSVVFDLEAKSHVGLLLNVDSEEADKNASYSQFIGIYLSWHTIMKQTLLSCLNSTEYMHIRSGLVFLVATENQYPKRVTGGMSILEKVQTIEKKEDRKRIDLSLMAKTLGNSLLRAKTSWRNDDGTAVSVAAPNPVVTGTGTVASKTSSSGATSVASKETDQSRGTRESLSRDDGRGEKPTRISAGPAQFAQDRDRERERDRERDRDVRPRTQPPLPLPPPPNQSKSQDALNRHNEVMF